MTVLFWILVYLVGFYFGARLILVGTLQQSYSHGKLDNEDWTFAFLFGITSWFAVLAAGFVYGWKTFSKTFFLPDFTRQRKDRSEFWATFKVRAGKFFAIGD